MGLIAATEGIYRGVKVGTSKTGKDWYALQFSLAENYKGMTIPCEQLASPNSLMFPTADDLDPNQLTPGHKYRLTISISTGKTGSGISLISFKPA